jgi:hypothetical protein
MILAETTPTPHSNETSASQGGSGPPLSDHDVTALDRTLSQLIANYQAAEEAYISLTNRPYPPYMEAARTAPGLSDEQWAELEAAYEAQSGQLAASDASDAAYDRMINFTQQLLGLATFSRDILRLKARACLFETPLSHLREEGFSSLAVLMAQLAAIDHDDG